MRKNKKQVIIDKETSYKKSNEISISKLNKGLTLNQMQLLSFAIYSTQANGKTEFHKADFEKRFNIEQFQTAQAKKDVQKLIGVQFSVEDIQNDYFEFWNVFSSIKYLSGCFSFKWNEDFIPHILELKEKYIQADLNITSKFKSSFSWALYEYLKAKYGCWQLTLDKETMLKLFCVDDKVTYIKNTARFKDAVLDVAIKEVNKYTELDVSYEEIKEGRKVVAFNLMWSIGQSIEPATKEQLALINLYLADIESDMPAYENIKRKDNKVAAELEIAVINKIEIIMLKNIAVTKSNVADYIEKLKISKSKLDNFVAVDNHVEAVENYNWLEDENWEN